MGCMLNLCKYSSASQGTLFDIITYRIEVCNISNVLLENITIKDILHSDLKFILGSVRIDYISDKNANIISGVFIGDLKPEECKVITFDVQIIDKTGDCIENQAIAEFSHQSNCVCQNEIAYSCICRILLKNPNLKLTKEVDKQKAELGDVLNYTLILSNTGDLDLSNLYLKDSITNSVKLIEGSFTVNGMVINSVELNKGVMLDDLCMKETMVIKYSVIIQSGGSKSKLCNESVVRYAYTLPNGICKYKESNRAIVCVDMAISSFKQISIEEYQDIPCGKPPIDTINDVKASIKINKFSVVKTPIAVSSEGQRLSGYKLVVHGTVNQVIEYVACEATQSLHSAHYSVPFSDYIVLPSDFVPGSRVTVEGIVEDIYYNVVSHETFFKNITVLLLAKVSLCK